MKIAKPPPPAKPDLKTWVYHQNGDFAIEIREVIQISNWWIYFKLKKPFVSMNNISHVGICWCNSIGRTKLGHIKDVNKATERLLKSASAPSQPFLMFSELSSFCASKITPRGKKEDDYFYMYFWKVKKLFSGEMKENSKDRFEFSKDTSHEWRLAVGD